MGTDDNFDRILNGRRTPQQTLDDNLNMILNDIRRTPQQLKDWELLKKYLKRIHGNEVAQAITNIFDIGEAKNFLEVLTILDNRFGQKRKWTVILSADEILELSMLDGDVIGMLNTLADANHKISFSGSIKEFYKNKPLFCLEKKDLNIFKELIKDDLFQKYSKLLNVIQEEMGCTVFKDPYTFQGQAQKVIELSKIEGDAIGAIYLLSSRGYRIEGPAIITQKDVEGIQRLLQMYDNQDFYSIVAMDLYQNNDTDKFKRYFSSLDKDEKKKKVITGILQHDKDNKDIQDWLYSEYNFLTKEVAMF